ncbi:hypothetical protein ACIGXM_36610 [Kitasatospora sp. NPDC052896]|uniref:hypothetical protein n=1 Tax=Kitasatospora sp. NPDC052896 TaxID=3364061 RepID=UPI0037CC41E3
MFVFVCARCEAGLTALLSQVSLPAHAHQKYGNGIQLPVLMESGTFAMDPDPWGPPWRRWDEIAPGEAEARGIYAPVYALSDGAPGAIVIAPGDIRSTRLIPEKRGGACCGLDGSDGPNMACEACGLAVASRIDDCSLWQAVWLAPDAVRRLLVDDVDAAPLSWEELMEEGKGTPPFEPIATWGSRLGTSHYWSWSPQWEAAAGRALAHLLAASEGRPVTVPHGLIADVFQRTLDALLPVGAPERHAVLAGPGRPAPEAGVDILLVPVHPQTGQTWTPADRVLSAYPVPLPLGVWLSMAFPKTYSPVPASGGIPHDLLRDDPLPPRPNRLFRPDLGTFQHTLVRLPAVRSPWLRKIIENLTQHMTTGLF